MNLLLTCEMKMPGSRAPKGTHEWSVPPIMENPRRKIIILMHKNYLCSQSPT